ncbi:MAG: family 16 glycosylhydrolase [Candidatus Ventricola sp.]
MHRRRAAVLAAAALLAVGISHDACARAELSTGSTQTVLFFDDFEGGRLDEQKWGYETGLLRNNEPQEFRTENVSLEDGCLVMTARREADGSLTSGSVHTAGRFEFGPGTTLEVRARLEGGPGAWPAIWLQASRFTPQHPDEVWPAGGEIDLMEAYPPSEGFETTIHYRNERGRTASRRIASVDADVEAWHIYGLIWTEETLTFMLDGQPYAETATANYCTDAGLYPFADDLNALFLHLNLAIHDTDARGRRIREIPDTMRFVVDWVRVTTDEPQQPCGVSFDQHEITVKQYDMLPLYVRTDPGAQDRTVRWEIEDERVLPPCALETVFGNLYARRRGTTRVVVTTPSGGRDVLVVTVK